MQRFDQLAPNRVALSFESKVELVVKLVESLGESIPTIQVRA